MAEKGLHQDVNIELENLKRLVDEMNQIIEKPKEPLNFVETRAAGSILHDFYCGIEKIFERIAVVIDKNLPKGEDWHSELLVQMAGPLKEKRNTVIDEETMQRLKEYLRFRHLFRNIYGFELKWERFGDLCFGMENLLQSLKAELSKFIV